MTRIRPLLLLLLSAFILQPSSFGQSKPPATSEPATQPVAPTDWRAITAAPQSVDLASIKPLPIVHFSWPIRPQDVLPTPAWWLNDVVRICRGVCFDADTGTTEAHVRALARIAAQYNAGVAIKASPYHATAWTDRDPRHVDPAYWPFWRSRWALYKSWVESEGAHVDCMIFDTEIFKLQNGDGSGFVDQVNSIDEAKRLAAAWNAALRARYNEAYDVAKEVFGSGCYVEWYSRGWQRPLGVTAVQRFAPYVHFDLSEKGDGVSAVITRPDWTQPSIESVYQTLMQPVLSAQGGVGILPADQQLVIWYWLGAGYRYGGAGVPARLDADYDWDYGVRAAAFYGQRLPRVSRVKYVIFYPALGSNPQSLRHFAAYAESAGAP